MIHPGNRGNLSDNGLYIRYVDESLILFYEENKS